MKDILIWGIGLFALVIVSISTVASMTGAYKSVKDNKRGCTTDPSVYVDYSYGGKMDIQSQDLFKDNSNHATEELPICSGEQLTIKIDSFTNTSEESAQDLYGIKDIDIRHVGGRGGNLIKCSYIDPEGKGRQDDCYFGDMAQGSNLDKMFRSKIDEQEIVQQFKWEDNDTKDYTVKYPDALTIPAMEEQL